MTKAEHYTALAETLRDFRTYSKLNQLCIDMYEDLANSSVAIDPMNTSISITSEGLRMYLNDTYNWDYSYDTVLARPEVQLSYGNAVEAIIEKEILLDNSIVLSCTQTLRCDIPKDQMILLELLGKVTVNVEKAQLSSVTKTVYCPTSTSF